LRGSPPHSHPARASSRGKSARHHRSNGCESAVDRPILHKDDEHLRYDGRSKFDRATYRRQSIVGTLAESLLFGHEKGDHHHIWAH
jgi:hypothetical protein